MINQQRNETLELFRIVFTVIICLHHSQLSATIHHGYLAVEFFFLCSGYMIAKTCCTKHYQPKEYFLNRLNRLYPHYLFSLVVITAYLLFQKLYHGLGDSPIAIGKKFINELLVLPGIGFETTANNYPMWYVAILLWGGLILYYLLQKWGTKYFVPIAIIGAVAYYISLFSASDSIEIWTRKDMLLRGCSDMIIGMAIYYVITKHVSNKAFKIVSNNAIIFIIGLLGTFSCIFYESNCDKYAIVFIVILFFSIMTMDNLCKIQFSALSKYSYPMYLNHALIIDIVRRILVRNGFNPLISQIIIILSIVLYSVITYYCVNKAYELLLKLVKQHE